MNNICQKLVVILLCAISVLVLYQAPNYVRVMAQNGNDISISLENASYVQLNDTASKLNVLVNYDVENKTLQDERINGVMKVYASNGTLVKYSSFPDGFLANETGVVEFKTTLKDPNLTDIAVNVTMFDIGKKNILSNTITSESSLQKPDSESNPFQPESN
ncbi:MAG TPA: hypothetical protein VF220_00950 [Nitrososphaeraceae archaeon]